jgi:hypothetical protein
MFALKMENVSNQESAFVKVDTQEIVQLQSALERFQQIQPYARPMVNATHHNHVSVKLALLEQNAKLHYAMERLILTKQFVQDMEHVKEQTIVSVNLDIVVKIVRLSLALVLTNQTLLFVLQKGNVYLLTLANAITIQQWVIMVLAIVAGVIMDFLDPTVQPKSVMQQQHVQTMELVKI